MTEDPDFLAFPLVPSYRFQPEHLFETFPPPLSYRPQPEDKARIFIPCGSSLSLWTALWYAKAAEIPRSALPQAQLCWIDGVHRPAEQEKRGGFTGIVVNGHPLAHGVFGGETLALKPEGLERKEAE